MLMAGKVGQHTSMAGSLVSILGCAASFVAGFEAGRNTGVSTFASGRVSCCSLGFLRIRGDRGGGLQDQGVLRLAPRLHGPVGGALFPLPWGGRGGKFSESSSRGAGRLCECV